MHWAALDGLRGIAVTAVVGYHVGVAPLGTGGWLGVDVFFVVSGFVVTTTWLRRHADGGSTAEFVARRAARLLPALAVYLAVVAAVLLGSGTSADRRALVASLFQVANFEMIARGPATSPTQHLWSLSIEWQFYLLLPFLLLAVHKRSRRLGIVALTGCAALSAATRVLLLGPLDATPWTAYLATPSRLDGLLLGAALAMAAPGRHVAVPTPVVVGAAFVIAAGLAGMPRWYTAPIPALVLGVTVVSICTAVVVGAVADGRLPRPIEVVLTNRTLRWLGERSYSIYLWHVLIAVVLIGDGEQWQGLWIFGLQIAASLAVATAAWTLVEQPSRRALTAAIDRAWPVSGTSGVRAG